MTANEYEQLPPEEKEHFATCSECGQIFDRRSLDALPTAEKNQANPRM
jgi:RNA polymerase-binding transcription factor DksA